MGRGTARGGRLFCKEVLGLRKEHKELMACLIMVGVLALTLYARFSEDYFS